MIKVILTTATLVLIYAVSVESTFHHSRFRYRDINRARSFNELLDIAQRESARADEVITETQERFRTYVQSQSANIQSRGESLISRMRNASESCRNTLEVEQFLNDNKNALDNETNKDLLSEAKALPEVIEIYQQFDKNIATILEYRNACSRFCIGRSLRMLRAQNILSRNRIYLNGAINRSDLGRNASIIIRDANSRLLKYEFDLRQCERNGNSSSTEKTVTDPNEVVTEPTEIVTDPNDVVTNPNEVVTDPNEVVTIPEEVTEPNDTVTEVTEPSAE